MAPPYLSDVEYGKKRLSAERLEELIAAYGFDGSTKQELRLLHEQAASRGWWNAHSDIFGEELLRFFGYEHGARSIRTYDGGLVHGLLQTEEYARAIIRAGSPNVRPAEVDRRLRARMERKQRLFGTDSLLLTAVMSEAALWQQVGGRGAQVSQLDHLLEMVSLRPENPELRVVPFTAAGHHAMGGSTFHLITFPTAELPTLVWQETVTSTELISDQTMVAEYRIAHEESAKTAFDHEDSLKLISEVRRALE